MEAVIELLQVQAARHRRGGVAIPNDYTIQELKNCICCPREPAVDQRPVAGLCLVEGKGLSHAQALLGRLGGAGRTLLEPLFPGADIYLPRHIHKVLWLQWL